MKLLVKIKRRLFITVFCLVLSLIFCINHPRAAMKSARELQDNSSGQRAFLEKYIGTPNNGYLIKNVPFYKQKSRNYCGPVVLCMVLNYWDTRRIFTQEEIASAIFNSDIEITNNSDMVFYPKSEGFLALSFNGDIEQLKNIVKKDIPLIILQQVVSKVVKKGHYRVVIGYDESKKVIILHDPWLGSNLSMGYDTFSKLWDFGKGINKYNWALVILPNNKLDIFNTFRKSALTHHNMATALYNREKIEDAIKEWKEAIEIAPEEATFYYCIAYAYIKEEIYDKAIYYAQQAVELDSANSFCHDTLGWAYYKKGMLQEAFRHLEKAMQMSPEIGFIRNHYYTVKIEINEGSN